MTGGWVRTGIAIDDAGPAEDMVVWWLQAPTRHCDLRVPFDRNRPAMSFAGTTIWAEPSLTWVPEIELEPNDELDTGVVTWDGADLMETGTYLRDGITGSYVERWQRLPGSDGELMALSSAHGRLVRTGPYALTIIDERPAGGAFAAVAWTLSADSWTVHHCWPAGAVAPAPPLSLASGQTTVRLSDGLEWQVDEHRGTSAR